VDHTFAEDGVHADMYLRGSVIRLQKTPIYINNVTSGRKHITLHYSRLVHYAGEDLEKTIHIDDPDINWKPIKVGMVPLNPRNAYHIRRIFRAPRRMWKVGLHGRNLYSYFLGSSKRHAAPEMFSQGMSAMMMNKYPSFKKVAKDGHGAFHIDWAVEDGGLYHRTVNNPVGVFQGGEAVLGERYNYLQEKLRGDL
tara:strand:+ start:328 stop:912 length:585 start_codon:yes stop_codon:yes gene_type:complete